MRRHSLRSWAARPLSERDRQRAFLLAAAILAAVATALTVTGDAMTGDATDVTQVARPTTTATVGTAAPRSPTPSAPSRARTRTRARAPERIVRHARRFLGTYLPYLYGQRPARRVVGASASLRRRLAGERPRVPPAARRRRPRVVGLVGAPVPERRGAWVVTARIDDGDVAVYPIELLIDQQPGGPVVVQTGGE